MLLSFLIVVNFFNVNISSSPERQLCFKFEHGTCPFVTHVVLRVAQLVMLVILRKRVLALAFLMPVEWTISASRCFLFMVFAISSASNMSI